MNCSPSGSSVLGIFWARMLEWIAIYFSSRFVGLTIKFRWIFSCLEGQHPQQLNCSRVNCIMNNHKLILHKIDHILSFLRASLVAQIVKHLPAMREDQGSIPGLGRSPGEVNGNPLQHSCLENPMDRGTWQATVHRVSRVRHNLATKPLPPPSALHIKEDA